MYVCVCMIIDFFFLEDLNFQFIFRTLGHPCNLWAQIEAKHKRSAGKTQRTNYS